MLNNKHIYTIVLVFLTVSLWGFAEASDKQINAKHAEAGITCSDCHQTDTPSRSASQQSCRSCHENIDAGENLILKSADGKEYSVNPHNAHTGSLRCTICHHIHSPSELYCNKECHHTFTISVP
ncbi:hypothetical protein EP073_07720 [Geovibrio thiophilus]|uniref:Tetrahaem cytochrome domain-containing protein n=1 Tax=Geovibrio thiophilus TaxID=139438 RepID=A0A410JYN6_9BACT|nr:hypothetical protein EP073_07720 [Geovibrio thiophilus]